MASTTGSLLLAFCLSLVILFLFPKSTTLKDAAVFSNAPNTASMLKKQFYVQTPTCPSDDSLLASIVGRPVRSYFVGNSTCILMLTSVEAKRLADTSVRIWMRPPSSKIASLLWTMVNCTDNDRKSISLIGFVLESNITSLRSSILGDLQRLRSSTKEEKLRTSLAFLADHGVDAPFELTADFLLHNRSIEISDAGQQALAITVDRCSAAALALYLVTHYPQLDFVEPKLGIGARGHYSSRHMSTGTSEESRTSTFLPWAPYGLNGSGVVISVADTGVDFMHSMFLQSPFPFPCYSRSATLRDGNELLDPACSASKLVAFLTQADFRSFCSAFLSSDTDMALLASGSTRGVESPRPPMDIAFDQTLGMHSTSGKTARQLRKEDGLEFWLGSSNLNESVVSLLDAISEVRRPLLEMYASGHLLTTEKLGSNISICSSCRGTMVSEHGLDFFTPAVEYAFDGQEDIASKLERHPDPEVRSAWRLVQQLLFEKCFCLLVSEARPAQRTLKNGRPDPVPPVRELIEMSLSFFATERNAVGKPALPPEFLHEMCQMAERMRVPQDGMQVGDSTATRLAPGQGGPCQNITIEWGDGQRTLNPCSFSWELRNIEETLAMCMTSLYLTSDPVDISDVTGTFNGHEGLENGEEIYLCKPHADVETGGILCGLAKKSAHTAAGSSEQGYKTAAQIKAEQRAREKEAAARALAAVLQQRRHQYTEDTVRSWWRQYSIVPPYNRSDPSRRKIIAYYGMEGCHRCGKCGLQERLNSRNFPGFYTKKALPTDIGFGEHFFSRVMPIEGDWRLDAFEARYTPFALNFSLRLSSFSYADAQLAWRHLQVCVMSNSTYALAEAETRENARAAGAQSTESLLFDFAGPTALRDLNQTRRLHPSLCQDSSVLSDVTREFISGRNVYSFELLGFVPELTPSAGGWFIVSQVGKPDPADIIARATAPKLNGGVPKQLQLKSSMRLLTFEDACSDMMDAPADNDWPEETWISSEDVRDRTTASCRQHGLSFCDDSFNSSRQLDECLVCGGDCFLPLCSAELGGCAAVGPSARHIALSSLRIRYSREFARPRSTFLSDEEKSSGATLVTASGDGRASKEFQFGKLVPLEESCPTANQDILCDPLRCRLVVGRWVCAGRRESYRVHSSSIEVSPGVAYIFPANSLEVEPYNDPRLWRLTIELVLLPAVATRKKTTSPLGNGSIMLPRLNVSNQIPVNVENASRVIKLVGNSKQLRRAINGLNLTAHAPDDFFRLVLRFRLQLVGAEVMSDLLVRRSADGACLSPWIGFPRCDLLKYSTDIYLLFETTNDLRRVNLPSSAARLPSRMNRGGHGTFVAGLAAGHDETMQLPYPAQGGGVETRSAFGFCSDLKAVEACEHETISTLGVKSNDCFKFILKYGAGVAACTAALDKNTVNSECKATLQCFSRKSRNHNSIAAGAKLVVVDLHTTTSGQLNMPTSFAEDVLRRPYEESSARISLFAFSCQDFPWWKEVDQFAELDEPTICNRYTSQAREIDEFVASHPDLVVIVAAGGDNVRGETMSVQAPGTCKNCLTVGSTQNWLMHLETASRENLASVCRPQDCPQFSKAGVSSESLFAESTCALPLFTAPGASPDCCHAKYSAWNYSADTLHWTSARGPGVSTQAAPLTEGDTADIYRDTSSFQAKRIKPEICTSGVHVVSARARSAKDTFPSTGAHTNSLTAMSGSSASAALAASAAALVRQYFLEGFWLAGFRKLEKSWNPSAALVRAVIINSGQRITQAMMPDGSKKLIANYLPNSEVGFGMLNLYKTLKVQNQKSLKGGFSYCTCISALSSGEMEVFGLEYGSKCAAWDSGLLPDMQHLNCSTLYKDHDAYAGELSENERCCLPWCFVSELCNLKEPSRIFPGRYVSYDSCEMQTTGDEDIYRRCASSNKLQILNVKTVFRDHASPEGYRDASLPLKVWPAGPPIAENETMSYNLTIIRATTDNPVSITLAYTDAPAPLSAADVIVNDLDLMVTVTPIKVASYEKMEEIGFPSSLEMASEMDALPRLRENSFVVWGNSLDGGDPHNNNEQVRLETLGPSEVVATIRAKRVANASGSLLSEMQGCATFALVVTGHLATASDFHHQVITTPNPLPVDKCGRRNVATLKTKSETINWLIILIYVVSGILFLLVVVGLNWARLRFRWRQFAKNHLLGNADPSTSRDIKTTNQHLLTNLERDDNVHSESQYVSDCLPDRLTPQCDGNIYICRGGGAQGFVLDGFAIVSNIDDAYTGMKLRLVSGPGAGQERIITGYLGNEKLALVAPWDVHPVAGETKYTLNPSGRSGLSFGGIQHVFTGEESTSNTELSKAQAKVLKTASWFDSLDMPRAHKPFNAHQRASHLLAGVRYGDLQHKGKGVSSGELFAESLPETSAQHNTLAMNAQGRRQQQNQVLEYREQVNARTKRSSKHELVVGHRHLVDEITGTVISTAPPLRFTLSGKRSAASLKLRNTSEQDYPEENLQVHLSTMPQDIDYSSLEQTGVEIESSLLSSLAQARAVLLSRGKTEEINRRPPPLTSLWSPQTSQLGWDGGGWEGESTNPSRHLPRAPTQVDEVVSSPKAPASHPRGSPSQLQMVAQNESKNAGGGEHDAETEANPKSKQNEVAV